MEVRNAIARLEILGEGSAGAVTLLDERGKRRRVGLVFGGTTRPGAAAAVADLLHRPGARALSREIREGHGARGRRGARSSSTSRSRCSCSPMSAALDRETLAQGHRVRRSGRAAAALRRLAARRRQRRAGAGAPAPGRPQPRRHPVLGHAEDLRGRSPARARSSACRSPAEIGMRRQILAEPDGDLPPDLGLPAGRHADRHRRQARRGSDRALPRHRRHDVVEPAAVRALRRHAAPGTVLLAGTSSDADAEARNAERRDGSTTDPRRLRGLGLPSRRRQRGVAPTTGSGRRGGHPPGFYGPGRCGLAPTTRFWPTTVSRRSTSRTAEGQDRAARAGAETIDLRDAPVTLALMLLIPTRWPGSGSAAI